MFSFDILNFSQKKCYIFYSIRKIPTDNIKKKSSLLAILHDLADLINLKVKLPIFAFVDVKYVFKVHTSLRYICKFGTRIFISTGSSGFACRKIEIANLHLKGNIGESLVGAALVEELVPLGDGAGDFPLTITFI